MTRFSSWGASRMPQRSLEAFRPHLAPPVHVAGMPAFQRLEHLPILAEIHVVGNLGGVIDVHDVHGVLLGLIFRHARPWAARRRASRLCPAMTEQISLHPRHIELRPL